MSSERGVPLAAAAAADAEDLHGRAARRQRPGPGGEPGDPARAALGHRNCIERSYRKYRKKL